MCAIAITTLPSKSATYVGAQSTQAVPTADEVKSYVSEQAKKLGLSERQIQIADFIIKHESTYCWRNGYFEPDIIGDEQIGKPSRGCFQISEKWHPEVPISCANDLECSTDWSLKRIKSGYDYEWTSWKFRCTYYPKEKPPGCKNPL